MMGGNVLPCHQMAQVVFEEGVGVLEGEKL
jgi:hypothetical protein